MRKKRRRYLEEEIDSMFGGIAAHQNDVGIQREKLLHQDLDVTTMKEATETNSCSCVSNVFNEAYW